MKKYTEMSIRNLKIKSRNFRKIANAAWVVGTLGPWFTPVTELKPIVGLGVYAYLVLSLYRNFAIDNAVYDNVEYKEFQKIYNEVLGDMVNLSKTLDNKSIMEHYALYNYLIDSDYLSCKNSDNKYHDVFYEPNLAPEYTLNGHGVCRHQAAMGNDFFTELGFENNFEVCYLSKDLNNSDKLTIIVSFLDNLAESFEAEGKFEEAKIVRHDIEIFNTLKDDELDEGPKKKVKNNHAIIKVNDDINTYLLDTAQRTFYTSSGYDPNVYLDYKGKKVDMGKDLRDRKAYNKISPTIITKDLLSIQELRNKYQDSTLKVVDNIDLIKKFNKENQDKLERAEEIYVKSLRK